MTELTDRNTRVVKPDESPMEAMQAIDHRSAEELGFMLHDNLSGESHYFKYTDDEIWLKYHPETEIIKAMWTEKLTEFFDLYSEDTDIVVVPVSRIPHWCENDVDPVTPSDIQKTSVKA